MKTVSFPKIRSTKSPSSSSSSSSSHLYHPKKNKHFATFTSLFILSLSIALTYVVQAYPLDPIEEQDEGDDHPRLSLISWRWDEVEGYFIVSVFLLTAALVKVAYHQIQALHMYIPESCVLIVLGTTVGLVIYLADITEHIPQFSSELFFFLLLPPIILESAYSLYDKTFFNNINTVLLYAVVGTLLNVFFVGSSLFLVERMGWFGREDIPLVECFTFSTLISAVDPVAVLAIFQELGVNKALYFLVFGESLFNDAVVITLYNMVTTFAVSRVISTVDVIIGILNFITVSGGGLLIGLLTGAVTAMVTRITTDVRVVEPLIVVALAYFSYVAAELFHFSGIISLIACGLVQSEYVKDNISKRSFTTIKYFTKTLSSIADVIIFFFLGRVLIREGHVWDTGFVFFSTFFCVFYRFVIVFLLTYVANRYIQRVRMINFEEQLLMAYGGLRGAIAFSLAIMLEENHVKHAKIFITTSLFIVLFTVFVLGSTTKPVVRWLEVQLHVVNETSMFIEINNKVVETVMSGIEEVAGHRSVNYWNQKLTRFNEKYLKHILTRGDGHSFKDTFELIYAGFIPSSKDMDDHHPPTHLAPIYHQEMTGIVKDVQQDQTRITNRKDDVDEGDELRRITMTLDDEKLTNRGLELTEMKGPDRSTTTSITSSSSSYQIKTDDLRKQARKPLHPSASSPQLESVTSLPSSLVTQTSLPTDTTSGSTQAADKLRRSFRGLIRVGSRTSRPNRSSLEEVDLERRFIASAFSRGAYYHLPEKDEVDSQVDRVETASTSATPTSSPQDESAIRRESRDSIFDSSKSKWATARLMILQREASLEAVTPTGSSRDDEDRPSSSSPPHE